MKGPKVTSVPRGWWLKQFEFWNEKFTLFAFSWMVGGIHIFDIISINLSCQFSPSILIGSTSKLVSSKYELHWSSRRALSAEDPSKPFQNHQNRNPPWKKSFCHTFLKIVHIRAVQTSIAHRASSHWNCGFENLFISRWKNNYYNYEIFFSASSKKFEIKIWDRTWALIYEWTIENIFLLPLAVAVTEPKMLNGYGSFKCT